MLVVTGTFTLEPENVGAFLDSMADTMRRSRGQDGCHEYTFAADPLVPGRVILSERWESRAHLDAHLGNMEAPRESVPTNSVEISIHEIASSERLV